MQLAASHGLLRSANWPPPPFSPQHANAAVPRVLLRPSRGVTAWSQRQTGAAGKVERRQSTKNPEDDSSLLWPELTLRNIEERVGEFKALASTIWFISGVILIEFGVEGLLDLWMGDDVVGAICCMVVGVSMVLWVRLSGFKMLSLWSSDNTST